MKAIGMCLLVALFPLSCGAQDVVEPGLYGMEMSLLSSEPHEVDLRKALPPGLQGQVAGKNTFVSQTCLMPADAASLAGFAKIFHQPGFDSCEVSVTGENAWKSVCHALGADVTYEGRVAFAEGRYAALIDTTMGSIKNSTLIKGVRIGPCEKSKQ